MKRIHSISFKHAATGFKTAVTTQPNFRFHLFAALVVTLAGFIFSVSITEWLALVMVIFLVIMAELFNTSIEAVVDLMTEQHNHYAKIAKDVSAAAVLLAAIGSVFVGVIIFLPKLLLMLGGK